MQCCAAGVIWNKTEAGSYMENKVDSLIVSSFFYRALFNCIFCKICVDEVLIRNSFGQLAGLLKNVLEKGKGFLLKDQIGLPGILLIVSGHNGGKRFQVSFLKLRLDDFGNLLRGVGGNIIHTFLKCIGKGLNRIGIGFDIAFLGTKGGVGNVAGVFA